jgi:hypothetical protein
VIIHLLTEGEGMTYSLEEKSDFVRAILENSVFDDREYYGLITEVLMQMPEEALEKIDLSLDHIVIMRKSTYALSENVLFTCVEKHGTHFEKEKTAKENSEFVSKPLKLVKPVYFQKYVIIFGLDNMKKLTQAQKLAVIAEEFAHVYLKHDSIGHLEKEEETEKLLESWGFHPYIRPNSKIGQRRTSALVQVNDFAGHSKT